MADRCVELEQQKVALSELLSQERAASSAAAAAASTAAAALQAEIAHLRDQVFVTLCPRDVQHDVPQHDALTQCALLCDTRQVARAPSAQEMAALQLQLQLHAAGARMHAPLCSTPRCDAVAAESNRVGDDLLSSLKSDLTAAAAIRQLFDV